MDNNIRELSSVRSAAPDALTLELRRLADIQHKPNPDKIIDLCREVSRNIDGTDSPVNLSIALATALDTALRQLAYERGYGVQPQMIRPGAWTRLMPVETSGGAPMRVEYDPSDSGPASIVGVTIHGKHVKAQDLPDDLIDDLAYDLDERRERGRWEDEHG